MSHLFFNQSYNRSPRRSRRGALLPAALFAVILFSVVLSSYARHILNEFRTTRAIEAASHIASIAKDFDQYVYANQTALISSMSINTVRELTNTETGLSGFQGQIREHRTLSPRGYSLTYFVGNFDGEVGPVGYIMYAANGSYEESYIDDIVRELAERDINIGSADGQNNTAYNDAVLTARSAVEIAMARPLSSSERTIYTPALSGINTQYVLRAGRAGVDVSAVDLSGANSGQDAIDLDSNEILNIDWLSANTMATNSLNSNDIKTLGISASASSGPSYVGPIHGVSDISVKGNVSISGTVNSANTNTERFRTFIMAGKGNHNHNDLTVFFGGRALSGIKAQRATLDNNLTPVAQVETFVVESNDLHTNGVLVSNELNTSTANINSMNITGGCFGC
jgi:hypothetical protein